MTTKQKHLSEVLETLFEESHKANEEATKACEKVEKGISELTDFARAVGIQTGINRCLMIISQLWDEAFKEEE